MASNWVHVIGVCGSTTAGIAVLFKELGWKVTGSDKGFYPPGSDFLKKYKIPCLPGFKMERLHEAGKNPDLVVIQGTKGDNNEEFVEAKRLGLKILTYPEVLKEFVIVPNSIVVAGSYGKTTTTAFLVSIFKEAGIPVSFMFGGLLTDLSPTIIGKSSATEYSIVEGDEYLTTISDRRSKFFHYAPKYLVLTGLEYDHADLFPTKKAYFDNFAKLVESMPKDGVIFANMDNQNVQKVLVKAPCRIVSFGLGPALQVKNDWSLALSTKPLPCVIRNPGVSGENLEIIPFQRSVLGKFNDLNILAAIVTASTLGLKKEAIQRGIKNFPGIKRRMEVRYKKKELFVIDDFGAAPAKAKATVKSLREEHPEHRVVIVFEPTAGNRDSKSLIEFKGVFAAADSVIIPKFTLLPKSKLARYSETDLTQLLQEDGVTTAYYPNDKDLLLELSAQTEKHKKIIIAFLGSHSFRGMIPQFIANLKNGI